MTDPELWTVDRVLALGGFHGLDDAKALNRIGALVDLADTEARADGVDQAMAWCAVRREAGLSRRRPHHRG